MPTTKARILELAEQIDALTIPRDYVPDQIMIYNRLLILADNVDCWPRGEPTNQLNLPLDAVTIQA